MENFELRILTSLDAEKFRSLRLQGLRSAPSAFGRSYEEYLKISVEEVATNIENSNGFLLGAFNQSQQLVGVIGVEREKSLKRKHMATVWGVYVDQSARGKGIGKRLMTKAIESAATLEGLEMLILCVSNDNQAAYSANNHTKFYFSALYFSSI